MISRSNVGAQFIAPKNPGALNRDAVNKDAINKGAVNKGAINRAPTLG